MELLIALLIGSILIVGVIQVFLASWTAYRLSQGIARNQESGRFALDFLTRDIRMAGHTGCINDQALLSVDDGGHPNGGNIRSLFLNAMIAIPTMFLISHSRCVSILRLRDLMPLGQEEVACCRLVLSLSSVVRLIGIQCCRLNLRL